MHIGAERRLSEKGVRVYEVWKAMASKILTLSKTFSVTGVILLGDIKDSILYPESWEQRDIKLFFGELSGLEVKMLKGNHDGHINDLLSMETHEELMVGDYALLHGNKWPSEKAMKKRNIITGHNHIAVNIIDENGAVYSEKAYIIAKADKDKIKEFYANSKAEKLIVMPAFNPLIMGMPVSKERPDKENINPLLRNGLFNYGEADVYSINGSYMGKVKNLSAAKPRAQLPKKKRHVSL
ncbi:MAG: metallophosphoesterase [Candidatus Marsarchaeota archaeon]|nr:metallophosphoesterase [Candidatus Marsarchaeota archaeon]